MMNADQIMGLVAEGIRESLQLDYKREAPAGKETDKFEFLKDVTAMANAQGGRILFGIAEGSRNEAKGIVGISDAEGTSKRLRDWCTDSISPSLPDLYVYVVTVQDADIIVVEIPNGSNKPYSYTKNGAQQYKMRLSDRIRDLRADEITELTLSYRSVTHPFGNDVRDSVGTGPVIDPLQDFFDAPLDDSSFGLGFSALEYLECLSKGGPSVVQKYRHGSKLFVLKRTPRHLCDADIIRSIVGLKATGSAWRLESRVAVPIAVREAMDFLYEMHVHVDGLSVEELIMRNKYRICGDFLGAAFNSMALALNHLHRKELVHRDVRPQNVFILTDGSLMLLDCTSVCKRGSGATVIDIGSYTAPEQLRGEPSRLSDWYSLAATTWFMGTGQPPTRWTDDLMVEETLDLGAFYAGRLVEALHQDPRGRPQVIGELLLREHSRAIFQDLRGVLDAGRLGFLVLDKVGYRIVARSDIDAHLKQVYVSSNSLRRDVEKHLRGQPVWLDSSA